VLPCAIAVDPTGRFAYVANTVENNVSAYNIDTSTGALTPMAIPKVAARVSPVAIALDPTGRFAYVTNSNSKDVSAYTIDANTGALTPMSVPTVATGGIGASSLALSR
jgi:6-phosphogluconolactonase (cycloisomerase 2 family)